MNRLFFILLTGLFSSFILVACGGGSDAGSADTGSDSDDEQTPVNSEVSEVGRLLIDATEDIIRPSYLALANESQNLRDSVVSFCQDPDSANLAEVQSLWRRGMSSWMAATVVQFGAVAEQDRLLRVQSFPVANSLLAGQVESLFQSPQDIDAQVIANSSVTVQGYPALEYLLFGDGASSVLPSFTDVNSGQRRCELLVGIVTNVSNISDELVVAWQGNDGDNFSRPLVVVGEYGTEEAAFDDLINSYNIYVSRMFTRKIAAAVGSDSDDAFSGALESWRSENSISNLQTNMQTLRLAFIGRSFGIDDYLQQRGNQALADRIIAMMDAVDADLSALTLSLRQLIETEQERTLLVQLSNNLEQLHATIEDELITELGVTRDFNAEDGD